MPRTERLKAIMKVSKLHRDSYSPLGNRSVKKTDRCSALKGGLSHARLHDFRYTVGSSLIHAGLHVSQFKTMLGYQIVNLTMDAIPLGGRENVEAVNLFDRPNRSSCDR
jgi:hypothetical protein